MKLHEDVMDNFIIQTSNVSALTPKKYGRLIKNLISFDTTINPEQLDARMFMQSWVYRST